jgi:hypothetical protein
MSQFDKHWFLRSMEAHHKGPNNLFTFGIKGIRQQALKFREARLDRVDHYHVAYQPNPFVFQYDLMVHIWINYYKILRREIVILREEGNDDLADELAYTKLLYGVTRSDFLFGAAELRWPTTILADGSHHGKLIREPWSERRVDALSDEFIKYVIGFGGSGQGKTTVFLAFCLMMWDHYIFTEKGARCMISTVNKDKLNSVGWSYIQNLNRSTNPDVSLYAGRGKVSGEWTIKRPNNKDTGGVFKGLLLGRQINDSTIVDKLTGSHGHHFIGYILDEAQSTPEAPLNAATNFTQTATDYRIMLAGNYDEDTDTLGANAAPDQGWKEVDEETGTWKSTMQNGNEAIVLHFNNRLSPGMDPTIAKKFPHLPNQKKLEQNTRKEADRVFSNINYRRFWEGWRVENLNNDTVMTAEMVSAAGADVPLTLSKIVETCFSFDSAPAEIDRNLDLIFRIGYDSIHTDELVFGPIDLKSLDKATDSLKYYRESSAQLLKIAQEFKIKSGGGIVDWTGRPGHAEHLHDKGFVVKRLIYNKSVPDGVRKDHHTGRIEKPWFLNVKVSHRDDEIPAERTYAHHVAENQISFGAWLCQQYIIAGRLKGINESLLDRIGNHNGIEKELYSRKFRKKNSNTWGRRIELVPKDEFKDKYRFSPDIQDTIFGMCFYAFLYGRIPLTPIGADGKLPPDPEEEREEEIEDVGHHQDLWEMDGLQDLYR